MADKTDDLKFSKEHEWVRIDGKTVVIGISEYAAEQLGDVVMVELPAVGLELGKGDAMGVVESVKSVSDVYAPVSGKVIEVNEMLPENPGIINEDPYGEGWVARIEVTDPSEIKQLLNLSDYNQFLSEEA